MNPKIVVVPSLLLLSTALCLAQTPAKPATAPAQASAKTAADATQAGKTHTGKMTRQTAAPAAHVMMSPDDLKWGPAPPGLPAGAQMAVLDGNPEKAGVPFTLRAKLPDGYTVPPHWHPTDERVTVLQGTLLVDHADKVNLDTAHALTAGSFMRMPKQMHHYASAKGETIIQVNGTGPFAVTYVNPADDPRKMTMTKK
jgi:hypothetical protein